MVPPSPYDVVDNHHLLWPVQQNNHLVRSSNAAGEIESIRRRSTSPSHCYYSSSSQSDRVIIIDQMANELIRPDYDPNQPRSSSIDPPADDCWLRLRLGSDDRQSSSSTPETRRGGGGLVELDLLPATISTSRHQQYQHEHQLQLQQQLIRSNTRPPMPEALLQRIPVPEINWALMRPSNVAGGNYYMANPDQAAAAASMSLLPMGLNFFARPDFGGATQMKNNNNGVGGGGEGMSSSRAMRIIRPPRSPNVGVWFMLQASQNQVRELLLPQIPKSYLRIKNGQMTIRLLMKYLVQKLGLESESEVEIRCRGQALEPILTLQHVRDSIWCIRRDAPLNLHTGSPFTSTSAVPSDSHIMILHYARPILSSATTTTVTTSSVQIF